MVSWSDLNLPPINLLSLGKDDSPCQGKCALVGTVCGGCHRTIDEITEWSLLEVKERYVIINRIYKNHPEIFKNVRS